MSAIRFATLIAVLGVATSSSAASITWAFEGQVTLIAAEPDTGIALSTLGVAPGSSFFGQLVFESETLDEDADATIGWYPGAISLFEVTIGGYHAAVSSDFENGMTVSVFEFVAGPYGLVTATTSGPGAQSLLNSPLLMLGLPGSPAYPIYGDELYSLLPPGLVEYDYDELFIAGIDGNIYGDLTSIAVAPEPLILALLAPLALTLVAIRRR